MAYTLSDLIESNIKDHSLAKELIDFLSEFATADAKDVNFEIDGGIRSVPTLKKLSAAINAATFMADIKNVSDRMEKTDTLTSVIIAKLSEMGVKDSPVWRSYPLFDGNAISDMSDPLYRANVENAVRFPFDAFVEVPMDRRNPSEWSKIGQNLLPSHTDDLVHGFYNNSSPSTPIAAGTINVALFPQFVKNSTYNGYWQWNWYYGWYYAWYRSYGFNESAYQARVESALSGSQLAQSFQVDQSRILKSIRLWSATAGSTLLNGDPKVIIVENTLGIPDLTKVIGNATIRKDVAYTVGAGAITTTIATVGNYFSFDLDNPTLLEANKSYSFIIISPNGQTINLAYNSNTYAKGGLFNTQDGSAWSQDLTKDLTFSLVCAKFTAGEQTIELQPLSVSGGVAAIKSKLKAIQPAGSALRLEVQLNNNWRDVELINQIDTLPPFTPVRLVVQATEFLAPVIDTVGSQITAFRPANTLRFTGKTRPVMRTGFVRLTISAIGYDETMHTISFALKNGASEISPTMIRPVISSNKTAQFEVTFNVGASAEYQLVINGTTKLATRVFDINAITEL